jgi:succinate dehydrogenase / fumarate reductase cytochrome b subunit
MAEDLHKPTVRPLSPFVTIFRWPVTMATSIVHRATGVGLAGGLLVLVWWLIAASNGPEAYGFFLDIAETTIGQLCLFGFTWALAYHAVNGIRHLAWDLGYGFQVKTADLTGILVFVLSFLIAIGVFVIAYSGHGGYYQ